MSIYLYLYIYLYIYTYRSSGTPLLTSLVLQLNPYLDLI